VFAGEIAAGPEAGGDGLELFLVAGFGDQDDEGRQVGVDRAEAVADPGAEAGTAADLVAGLHVGDGGLVVDGLGVHRPDDAQVVDALGGPREQFGVHPHAAPAVRANLYLEGAMGKRD
jgi:hypothetical protein